jgi:hypothetical protein
METLASFSFLFTHMYGDKLIEKRWDSAKRPINNQFLTFCYYMQQISANEHNGTPVRNIDELSKEILITSLA